MIQDSFIAMNFLNVAIAKIAFHVEGFYPVRLIEAREINGLQ